MNMKLHLTKVNMPSSRILAPILVVASISSGLAFHGVMGSLLSRFFTNSIQPSSPVFLKSPIEGCLSFISSSLSSI